MLRQKRLLFLSIYFLIIIGLILSYIKLTSVSDKQLSLTLEKMKGVEYIHNLQTLNFNLAKILYHNVDKDLQITFKKKILKDIEVLLILQKENPAFRNDILKQKFENLKDFQLSSKESYELIDYLNKENYIIGEKSHLIYEANKKTHLLSTLYTHYLPEYLLSTLVCHTIAENFNITKELTPADINIFLEQNKLINLSIEELDTIITILSQYAETQELKLLIIQIKSTLPSSKDIFTKYIDRYIKESHKTLDLSYKLLNINYVLLSKSLKNQQKSLEHRLLNSTIIFYGIVLLFSVILFLYYKSRISNISKNQELYNMQKVLDKFALLSKSDKHGKIIYASSAFETLTGFSKKEIIGSTYKLFNNPKMNQEVFKELWETVMAKKVFHGEILNRTKSGKDFWVKETVVPELDLDGNIQYLTTYMVDITDHKKLQLLNKKLEELSTHDTLTGVYNRLKIDTILQALYKSYKRYKKTFSIILLDIDYFKKINDTYGHLIGDEILKTVAARIQKNIRESDSCGRWGGEEFLIICEHTTKDDSFILAEKIRKIIKAHTFANNSKITISSGISQIADALTLNELIQEADEALYEAKHNGRDQSVIYTKQNKG